MRQTATYTFPSPWPLQLLLWIAAFALAFCIHATTAHAGPQLPTNRSSQPSIRRLRRETRISVLRPVRAKGRAAAGYPFLQTTANVTRIGVNLSGLINPIGWFF